MSQNIIIFLGTIGIYHPLLAAYLYTDTLETEDFSKLKFWGDRNLEENGELMFTGYDPSNNPVYCLGAGAEVTMTEKSIHQLAEILGRNNLLVQTISIEREQTLQFLYQLGAQRGIKKWADYLIEQLIKKELIAIRKQINQFRDQVRFV